MLPDQKSLTYCHNSSMFFPHCGSCLFLLFSSSFSPYLFGVCSLGSFWWFVSLLTCPVSSISWTHLLLFFTRTHVPELFCSALTCVFCVSDGNALILHQAVWLLERRKTAFCYLKDFCLKNRCSELPCLASALCSVPWTPQKLWGGATQVGFEFGSCHLTDNL